MNYYNPYYMMAPLTSAAKPSIFGALTRGASGGGLTLSSIVNGTQKTLGIINQAIPIVKQVSPVMKNAKTMFRVMNEFKKVDTPSKAENTTNNANAGSVSKSVDNHTDTTAETKNYVSNEGPTFFI